MKKKWLPIAWITDPLRIFRPAKIFLLSLGIAAGGLVASAPPAHALQELDRQYSLDTVGVLRAWDNVDGLFGDYVGAAYREYFSSQNRFNYIDLSRADPLLQNSKIPYTKLIEDEQILRMLSRSMRAQTILRTRVYKEGPVFRFQVDWIHMPKADLLATDTFQMEEPRDGRAFGEGEVRAELFKAMDRMIKKIPFLAQVTGRDGRSVTVGVSGQASVSKGDTLVVASLEEVKHHPLLKAIVDWRFSETGRIEVESIDGGIAFCKILEEQPDRQITRYQKVIQIIPAESNAGIVKKPNHGEGTAESGVVDERPSLGYLQASLWLGEFERDYTSGGTAPTTRDGTGVFFGAKGLWQLWFTREWFGELGFGGASTGFKQLDSNTGQETSDIWASVFDFNIDFGYTLFTSNDFYGPKAQIKAGYHTTHYTLPTFATDDTGSSTFSGVYLGLAGDLPLRGEVGANFSLDFGVINAASEQGFLTGTVNGSSNVDFYIGGYYQLSPRMTFKAGVDIKAQTMDFTGGGSLSHKIISLMPGLVYYF